MEVERDHVLGKVVKDDADMHSAEEDLMNQANATESASGDEAMGPWEALGSQATFDRVLYDGGEFGHAGEVHVGSEEEMDFLGIPGLLEPDQVRDHLRTRQRERAAKQKAPATTPPGASVAEASTHERNAGVVGRPVLVP